MEKMITTLICILSCVLLKAQVLNDWQDRTGLVTTMEEGVISEDDYAAQGIFSSWDAILKDFEQSGPSDKEELENEIRQIKDTETEHRTRLVTDRNGVQYNLPEIIAEDGTDMYLLTNEGINIYMALDAPVYFQEIDEEIIRWVRYYAHRKKSSTKKMFQRYKPWEQNIKQYFLQNGVPTELAELCLIESACTYKALSHAGALGMWQIMPETGRRFGLRIDDTVDERLDPVLSTFAAAKILNANYKRVGEWTLAAAAYNCGAGRILKYSGTRKYWPHVKPVLPKETQQYISCLIAIHYVWTYRDKLAMV